MKLTIDNKEYQVEKASRTIRDDIDNLMIAFTTQQALAEVADKKIISSMTLNTSKGDYTFSDYKVDVIDEQYHDNDISFNLILVKE